MDNKKPPVDPTGASKIEISKQLGERLVLPVHKHLPFIQAPFLLQLNAHVAFVLQQLLKSGGQVKVPVRPTGAGIFWPGILQIKIDCPTKRNNCLPEAEQTFI